MRCTQFGLVFLVLVSILVACAQPADTSPPPAGECNASQMVCESVVVTPPVQTELPDVPPSEPQTLDQLRFQARLVLRNTALNDEPTGLKAVVTVENPTAEAVTLDMTGCQLVLLAYELSERPSDSRYARATYRADCLDMLRLEPGSTQRIELDLNDYQLSSKLADGRYSFDLNLVLPEHVFTFTLGSADIRFSIPNLGYKASTHQVNERLLTSVVVENHNDEPVLLTYGHCALLVRLYRTADRTGEPAYSRVATPDGLCLGYLASSEVEPKDSLLADEFEVSIPLREIEGAVAEPGYYYVQLSLELDWREMPMNTGVLYVAP